MRMPQPYINPTSSPQKKVAGEGDPSPGCPGISMEVWQLKYKPFEKGQVCDAVNGCSKTIENEVWSSIGCTLGFTL